MTGPLLNIELPIAYGETAPLGSLDEDGCYAARSACEPSQERLIGALAALEVELGTTRIATVSELPYAVVQELVGHLPVSQFR